MRLFERFNNGLPVFSLEVFPPKAGDVVSPTSLFPALKKFATLNPSFISVTFGAGAKFDAISATCEIAEYIKNELRIESLAHLTCVNLGAAQVREVLARLAQSGVNNVMALRGDTPNSGVRKLDFAYASDLAAFIKANGSFNIAGACYPEGHFEAETLEADVDNLRYKLDAGVNHLITQLFFDNSAFFNFINLYEKKGYKAPVQCGIMPIVNARQVERVLSLSSASMPHEFTKLITKYSGNPAGLFDAGTYYAITQIRALLEAGVHGIHLYSMNNFEAANAVYNGIKDLLGERP